MYLPADSNRKLACGIDRSRRVPSSDRLLELLRDVKSLAREYYEITGRPLGVTAEIAEFEAARLLGLTLSPARQAGYDAIRITPRGEQQLQIKGRRIIAGSTPGQRVGAIDLTKPWDAVLLVLLDAEFCPTAIYEADRPEVARALAAPGSRARNERGQLSVAMFRAVSKRVWPNS
jgi:hypothetical protein